MTEKTNQITFTYIVAGAAGLLTGLAAAYLLLKNQKNSPDQKTIISSKDGLKIGVGLASLLRQIAELGSIQ